MRQTIEQQREERRVAEQRAHDKQVRHDLQLQAAHDSARGRDHDAQQWAAIEQHASTLERHGVDRADALREAARLRGQHDDRR